MNVNGSVIPSRQEVFFWMMQLFGHILYLYLSFRTQIQMQTSLFSNKKKKKENLGGKGNIPEENHRCSSQVNPTPYTHMQKTYKWSWICFPCSFSQLVCVNVLCEKESFQLAWDSQSTAGHELEQDLTPFPRSFYSIYFISTIFMPTERERERDE